MDFGIVAVVLLAATMVTPTILFIIMRELDRRFDSGTNVNTPTHHCQGGRSKEKPVNIASHVAITLLALLIAAHGFSIQSLGQPNGRFISIAAPAPKTVSLDNLYSYDVFFVLDLEDNPENRKRLRDIWAAIDKKQGFSRIQLQNQGAIDLEIHGEFGGSLILKTPIPKTWLPGAKFDPKYNPFLSYYDRLSRKKLLAVQPFFVNADNVKEFRNVGRAIFIQLRIFGQHIGNELPLKTVLVNHRMRRPTADQLREELGSDKVTDPEVTAWGNLWMSVSSRHLSYTPDFAGWTKHFKKDPNDPKTRAEWRRRVWQRYSQSVFEVSPPGYMSFYDQLGRLFARLYEKSFGLVGDQNVVAEREYYANKALWDKGNYKPIYANLWKKKGKIKAVTEPIGTHYTYRDFRRTPESDRVEDLIPIFIDETASIGVETSASNTRGSSTTDRVSVNAGIEIDGLGVGGSMGQDKTNSKSNSLSNMRKQDRLRSVKFSIKARPGNLYVLETDFVAQEQTINAGQFRFSRYVNTRKAGEQPRWVTYKYCNTKIAYKNCETEDDYLGEYKRSAFRRISDPETLAILNELSIPDLGKRFLLTGRWTQMEIDNGEMSQLIVGPKGFVWSQVKILGQREKLGRLTKFSVSRKSVTMQDFEDEKPKNVPKNFKISLDISRSGNILKVVFSDQNGVPLHIWYRR